MEFQAKDVAILVQSGSPLAYGAIGAFRTAQLQITHSEEDITSKGSNLSRRLYTAGALKSMSISGEFVLTDEAGLAVLQTAAESADPKISAKFDDGTSVYTSTWLISQWQIQGGSSGAAMGSCTLQSAEAVVVTAS